MKYSEKNLPVGYPLGIQHLRVSGKHNQTAIEFSKYLPIICNSEVWALLRALDDDGTNEHDQEYEQPSANHRCYEAFASHLPT
jgi:hypothetical protein